MSEKNPKILRITQLPDDAKQNIINLLREEGLNDDYIGHLPLIERNFKNPRSLNEIIFDIQGLVIHDDDWDKNIDSHMHMGKLKDCSAGGKVRQIWGALLHEQAFLYLKEKLKGFGWKLKYGQEIDGKEYDCLGWKGKIKDAQHPDLAIEMYFPLPPRTKGSNELPYIAKHPREMREKLRKINAKHKYVLIGVPRNKIVKTLEIAHPDMKVVYQRHRFGKIALVKQKVLSHEM